MTIEELKTELSKGVKYFLENPKKLANLHRQIYGEASFCHECERVLIAKYNALNNLKSVPGVYKMRCGHVISYEGNHYTCKNINDEIAPILIELGWGKIIYKT